MVRTQALNNPNAKPSNCIQFGMTPEKTAVINVKMRTCVLLSAVIGPSGAPLVIAICENKLAAVVKNDAINPSIKYLPLK